MVVRQNKSEQRHASLESFTPRNTSDDNKSGRRPDYGTDRIAGQRFRVNPQLTLTDWRRLLLFPFLSDRITIRMRSTRNRPSSWPNKCSFTRNLHAFQIHSCIFLLTTTNVNQFSISLFWFLSFFKHIIANWKLILSTIFSYLKLCVFVCWFSIQFKYNRIW